MSPNSERAIVIMAGGSGERFWPVSNRKTPKQLLRLHGGRTMLEAAYDRAALFVPRDRIFVAAGEGLRDSIAAVLPSLPSANYIAEPFARNTAGCLGLAACWLERAVGPAAVMGVLTADHVIDDGPDFQAAVNLAFSHAAESGDLVTLGIQPTHPETGFGYLELGDPVAAGSPVRRVRRFTEKPDAATAERFFESGGYLWNSGMFFWRAGALLAAFEAHQPAMAAQWGRLRGGELPFAPALVEEVFHALPSLPIDTAIMEKSANVAAIPGRFAWEDIGSWDALARVRSLDADGNCAAGPVILLDSHRNIIYSEGASDGNTPGPEIVLHGVEDMIIVQTGKALLITPRSRVQGVKDVVRHLKQAGRDDLI